MTIRIKKTNELPWWALVLICVVLLGSLIAMGLLGKTKRVDASDTLQSKDNAIRITIAGDVEVTDSLRRMASSEKSYARTLRGLSRYWDESDYVMANVNGPVLSYDVSHYESTRRKSEESLYLRPAALRGLQNAGINLFNFANDDTYNYGRTGISSTIRVLEQNELQPLGIAEDTDQPYYRMLKFRAKTASGKMRTRSVAILCVNDVVMSHSTVAANRAGIVNSSLDGIYELAMNLAKGSDFLIVYMHGGREGSEVVTEEQNLMAHQMVDLGADLVIGSHSHMLQSVEQYKDATIVYGLGDLISGQEVSWALDSALTDLVITKEGQITLYLTPLRLVNSCPRVTTNKFYQMRIQRTLTSEMDKDSYMLMEDGVIAIPMCELPSKVAKSYDKVVKEQAEAAETESEESTESAPEEDNTLVTEVTEEQETVTYSNGE